MSMRPLSKHVKYNCKAQNFHSVHLQLVVSLWVISVVWMHTIHQCLYRAQVRNPYNEAFMGSCTWAMLASSPGHTWAVWSGDKARVMYT